jgi:hypothetical protein
MKADQSGVELSNVKMSMRKFAQPLAPAPEPCSMTERARATSCRSTIVFT